MAECVTNLFGIKVTALTRIDLMGLNTSSPNPLGIIAGLLVAFNDTDGEFLTGSFNRCTK